MRPDFQITTVNLSAPDPHELAGFYSTLLGWSVVADEPDWLLIRPEDPTNGSVALSFQTETGYVRPVWPPQPGAQQMMIHLDIRVADLAAATSFAVECGAVVAEHQPQDDVRVLLDPAGHPFCLWVES